MSNKINDYDWLHLHHEDLLDNTVSFIGVIEINLGIKKWNLILMLQQKTWF